MLDYAKHLGAVLHLLRELRHIGAHLHKRLRNPDVETH